jgi:hypothetical protein
MFQWRVQKIPLQKAQKKDLKEVGISRVMWTIQAPMIIEE